MLVLYVDHMLLVDKCKTKMMELRHKLAILLRLDLEPSSQILQSRFQVIEIFEHCTFTNAFCGNGIC